MSDIHSATAALLAAASIGTPGVDLFVYEAPTTAQRFAVVVPDLEGTPHDENLPGYFQSRFSVIVRDSSVQAAMDKADSIANALDLHNQDSGAIRIKRMRPTHKPIFYRVPDSDLVEASVNVWAAYTDS